MRLLSLLFLLSSSLAFSQNPIDKELFFIGYGQTFSIEDQALGFNFRAGLPMQKGFDFNIQATYLPDIMNYGYNEFRYLFNVELTIISLKRISIYGIAGLDFGYWKRTKSNAFVPVWNNYTRDNSLVFGGGLNYSKNRIEVFLEDKFLYQINRNHLALGIRYKIFESADLRERFYNFEKNRMKKVRGAQ